jgi:hypothetical protein
MKSYCRSNLMQCKPESHVPFLDVRKNCLRPDCIVDGVASYWKGGSPRVWHGSAFAPSIERDVEGLPVALWWAVLRACGHDCGRALGLRWVAVRLLPAWGQTIPCPNPAHLCWVWV